MDCKQFVPSEESLPINLFNPNDQADSKFSQFNGEFLHFQILVEILLRMKQHKKDRKELVSVLRKEFRKNEAYLKIVEEFNSNYTQEKAIWWYTREDFISQSLNEALRTQNIDMLVAFRSFMTDIRRQLSYHQCDRPIQAYRGLLMSRHELKTYQNSIGQFISINSFFSTCLDENEATRFIKKASNMSVPMKSTFGYDSVPVLFRIYADPQIIKSTSNRPFADISSLSGIKTTNEVLFMVGSIFHLKSVKVPDHKNNTADGSRIAIIVMELCGHKQHALHELYDFMMKECDRTETDFLSLSKVLIKMNKIDLAEKYVNRMFDELSSNDPLLGDVYQVLGYVADHRGDIKRSLSLYEKSLTIKSQANLTDHVSICTLYNSIGVAYQKKNDSNRALQCFNKAVSLFKQANDNNHPLMASLNINIGLIYVGNGSPTKALEFYQKALTIKRKQIPKEHPSFAELYNNMGTAHYLNNDYNTALEFYQRSLKIKLSALPPAHPDIALAHKNIGLVSEDMDDYEQALAHYRSAETIYKRVLPSGHADMIEIRKDIERVSSKLKHTKKYI